MFKNLNWKFAKEPVLYIAVAVAVLVFGVDLEPFVERIGGVELDEDTIDSFIVVLGAIIARGRVSPVE